MSKISNNNFLGVGWSFPTSVDERGNTNLSYFEKSITESIKIILGTSPGERLMRPDFGCKINDLIFSPNNSNTHSLICHYIEESITKWEPRVILDKVEAYTNEFDDSKIDIYIEYKVRSVNTAFNMVYPFYLERGESDTKSQFG